MNYENDTRNAYRDEKRAREYKRHLSEDISWARFAMWREKRCISDAIKRLAPSSGETVLDAPCGTGILSPVFERGWPGNVVSTDISMEMMNYARMEYSGNRSKGFVRSDLTGLPFADSSFSGAVVVGFMHRVPLQVRTKTLGELKRVVSHFIIVTYSEDNLFQRLKRHILSLVWKGYAGAPSSLKRQSILREFKDNDLDVIARFHTLWGLSSEVVYVLKI